MVEQPLTAESVDVLHGREDTNHDVDSGILYRQNRVVGELSGDISHFGNRVLISFG